MNADAITRVPRHADILQVAAHSIVDGHDTLPDLTGCTVLLPDLQFAATLRERLLQAASAHGHGALLGPSITTLDSWLAERLPLPQQIPGRAQRELMLVEVIRQHPDAFAGADPWQLCGSLIALFDELTLHRVHVPDDLAAFTARLQAAYGIEDTLPEPLGREASLVHRLWQAWHNQLNDEHMLDPGVARLQRLALAAADASVSGLVLVGFDDLPAAELEWLDTLLQNGQARALLYDHRCWLPGDDHPPMRAFLERHPGTTTPATRGACLDAVYDPASGRMAERIAALTRTQPDSPLEGAISVFAAASPEQEARAVDIRVREWLIEGRQRIAIVSEDRRLARRVRALLERAGIHLQDHGGWALSTTSAAAVLERWLETVEEDFAHVALLDVLKSPFIFPDTDREQHEHLVYRLEQDIIQRENIASGLQRYQAHIDRRLERYDNETTRDTAQQLHRLLQSLQQAAAPLQACLGTKRTAPQLLLERLLESLDALGIRAAYVDDIAGQRILGEIQLLHDAADGSSLRMTWPEFRAWLGSALERHDFVPPAGDSPVTLLTLQQAQAGQFDALVMAACDREHLPAQRAPSPFFNDPVRRDLGLPGWPARYQTQLHRWQRLLQAAPEVLLTWHREAAGETRLASAWLEALCSFHQQAWGSRLDEATLPRLVDAAGAQVRGGNPLPVPAAQPRPRPSLSPGLLPAEFSVSMHRHLIDCPYRFFAAAGLGLKPREDVREAFEKAEYGSLVHQALELFHRGKDGYPPAFQAPITAANRDAAIQALEAISDAVFLQHLEDNFEHRAWRRRWQVLIPHYVDWQMQQQQQWTFHEAEGKHSLALAAGHTLAGRLDRVDTQPGARMIIDYKTGATPRQDAVDSGEEVQLASYALLLDELPQRVVYLAVDGDSVASKSALEGDALATLATAVRERLDAVLGEIEAGAALPAWGDERTCDYCEMSGLCRKQAWTDA